MTPTGKRSHVVSSFTIIKGAMIEETYSVFAGWDFDLSKHQNLDLLRQTNFIGAKSLTWLRDIAWVLNRRFDPTGRDRPLVVLAKNGCDLEEWKPLLLWHITRDEFLLRDFLQDWLFSQYQEGAFRIRPEQLHQYLRNITKRGATTEHVWTDATLKRVAAGLLKIAVDFGILRGKGIKEFSRYHLPDRSLIYLLYAMRDERISPARVVGSPDWRMFLMRPGDVEHALLRLHQFRRLEYHVAGSLVQLSLPCADSNEYAERMLA